jgi:hypothetical protein
MMSSEQKIGVASKVFMKLSVALGDLRGYA